MAGGTEEFAGTGASASLSSPSRPGPPLPGRGPPLSAHDAHHDNLRLIVRPPAFSCEALHAWMGRRGGLDATFQLLTLLGLGQPQLALQRSDSLTRLRPSLQISHTLSEQPDRHRLCTPRADFSTSLRLRLLGDGSPLVSAARLLSRQSPRLDVLIASAGRLCATRTFHEQYLVSRRGELANERASEPGLLAYESDLGSVSRRRRFRTFRSRARFAPRRREQPERRSADFLADEARPLAPRLALSLSRHASTPLFQR